LSDSRRSLSKASSLRFLLSFGDETLSVAAMCVNNPDRSPVGINRCDAGPTPTGFAEIVSDYFPILPWTLQRQTRSGRMAFECRCTKHLNPLGLASLFARNRVLTRRASHYRPPKRLGHCGHGLCLRWPPGSPRSG